MLVSVKLSPRRLRKVCGVPFPLRGVRTILAVSEREVDCQRMRFRPSPGVTETSLSRGAVRSILIVTETEFESGGFARFDAEHVRVVPGVSLVSVCGSQPLDVEIPVGSETVHETVTSDRYQPASPVTPETSMVIEGGAIEPLDAAAGASARTVPTAASVRLRPLRLPRVAPRAGLFQLLRRRLRRRRQGARVSRASV